MKTTSLNPLGFGGLSGPELAAADTCVFWGVLIPLVSGVCLGRRTAAR